MSSEEWHRVDVAQSMGSTVKQPANAVECYKHITAKFAFKRKWSHALGCIMYWGLGARFSSRGQYVLIEKMYSSGLGLLARPY